MCQARMRREQEDLKPKQTGSSLRHVKFVTLELPVR